MSKSITLQAALIIPKDKALAFRMSVPSGTVVTFLDADDEEGVAEQLWSMTPSAMKDNLAQLDRTITSSGIPGITDGHQVLVSHGAGGARTYHDFNVSASPSASPSLSPSASPSSSPSASASRSPSSSASRSPSASPSASS
jgi:hypothetical protein